MIRIFLYLSLASTVIIGCAAHRQAVVIPALDPDVEEARQFVEAISSKMPLWDEDALERYERVEIATVKADIAVAKLQKEPAAFMRMVDKLHDDWDALVVLDEKLKKMELI